MTWRVLIAHAEGEESAAERLAEPLIARLDDSDSDVWHAAAGALGQIGDMRAVEPLIARLDDENNGKRLVAAEVLGSIGDTRAVEPLIARLDDPDSDVRREAMGGLSQTCKDEMDRMLLTKDLDGVAPFLDPQEEIAEEWVRQAAEGMDVLTDEVRRRYEALSQQFPLKLAWRPRAAGSKGSSESK